MPHKQDLYSFERQKQAVQSSNFFVEVVAPCKVNHGIIQLTSAQKSAYKQLFSLESPHVTFFIPASGSGSRMFEKVYEVSKGDRNNAFEWVENWMSNLPSMAIFHSFPEEVRHAIKRRTLSVTDFVKWLIENQRLRIQTLPKGLLPFHVYPNGIRNAFQDHFLQGIKGFQNKVGFHFTIQSQYEGEIRESLHSLQMAPSTVVDFSEQFVSTNSVVFDEHLQRVSDERGELLTRPSGHGALLTNLDTIHSEFIYIKNIDNVQHGDRSAISIDQWQILSGILIDFRNRAKLVLTDFNREKWQELITQFQLTFSSDEWLDLPEAEIRDLLSRPYRVCGMVKNMGQPGGGPFWVKKNDRVSKQIVEKAQINSTPDQLAILEKSTHFNPVMLVVSPYDLEGKKLSLHEFVDNEQFFVVHKMHQGKSIRYIERPGLWNGSMANWNTVFIEIPSEAFSPVKTITDLLEEAHQPMLR